MREQCPDLVRCALRMRPVRPPHVLQGGILREDLFDRGSKRRRIDQARRDPGEDQRLQFAEAVRLGLGHESGEHLIPRLRLDQIEQMLLL